MRPSARAPFAALALAAISVGALGALVPASPASAGAIEEVAAGGGLFGVLDNGAVAQVDLELRFPRFLTVPKTHGRATIAPIAGAMTNADGARYAYGGFRLSIPFGERWLLAPYTGAGVWGRGDSLDLGGPLEFRSGAEISYRVGPRSRLGLSFYHLSNARLYEVNPGVESLVVVWSYRLRN